MGNGRNWRADRALDSAIGALDSTRATLARRLDELNFAAMRQRGFRYAGSVRSDMARRTDSVRSDVARRIEPPRQRMSAWGVAGITGIVLLGAAAIGIGYVVYDRERREAARRRLNDAQSEARRRINDMQSNARDRYAELTGGRTRAEADLEERVRQAITNGGAAPQDLDVVVEGRTVYLRGGVADPAAVDAAAERIHGVPGVVAVVNLTTSARQQTPQHS